MTVPQKRPSVVAFRLGYRNGKKGQRKDIRAFVFDLCNVMRISVDLVAVENNSEGERRDEGRFRTEAKEILKRRGGA